ncbi:hypothetical protein QR680_018444 [Steinernema hermaphroditum]|uniref:Uncharacterized protein n=1 Tax=Steinernema hermaphroditum TaxID=289476 RepID=A0AA39HHZ4_9BILA|nr:hypothetical protein QR680_018444 [Steinernema hermaphroditum]
METTQPTFTKDMVYVMGVVMITLELVLLVVGAALQVLLVVMVHRAKLFHRNFRSLGGVAMKTISFLSRISEAKSLKLKWNKAFVSCCSLPIE